MQFQTLYISGHNMPPGVGARGYINPRNMSVLATFAKVCKVRNFKKMCHTVGKISLIASYNIWLARRSNDWALEALSGLSYLVVK